MHHDAKIITQKYRP